MFNFLKRLFPPPLRIQPKKIIWMNDRACHAAFYANLDATRLSQNVLIVAHFADELDMLRDELSQRGIDPEIVTRNISPTEITRIFSQSSQSSIVLTLSKFLKPTDSSSSDATEPLIVMVLGMHPLPQHDERVKNFVQSFGNGSTLDSYISLEHPAMKSFGGDWVREWLQKMGMKESEAIESRMVTRRLEGAQQKIAKSVTTDYEASSAEAWMTRNWPNAR
jgi:hypothetical protein